MPLDHSISSENIGADTSSSLATHHSLLPDACKEAQACVKVGYVLAALLIKMKGDVCSRPLSFSKATCPQAQRISPTVYATVLLNVRL